MLIFNHSDALTYSGVISGNGSLAKLGAGTLTLTGSNSYTGTTTVSGGTLAVTGSLSGSITVTTDNGGTMSLSGNGSLSHQNQYVGYSGTGTFTQSGGTNSKNQQQ